MIIITTSVFLILCAAFAYKKFSSYSYLALLTLYLAQYSHSHGFWITYALLSATLIVPPIRKIVITTPIVFAIKKLGFLPKISETERIALTSGNTWVDGELFSGRPNFKWIFSQKFPQLTKEEKSFLDNEVEEVCKICIDHEVYAHNDLPDHVWKYLRDKKFFGMIIPKEYGGLGFSAYGHSCVIQKLASRSVPLAITVMVPNSLGPGELLMHYGTQKQRDYYLPRLADGTDLPCFALTESGAGSDATSISSNGVLFKDESGEVKIRLNFSKRYITLGAYATIIGVAFQLRDPDKILSDKEELGITCAIIPNSTAGVRQGRRHDPLATPFINSPINGDDVIIGLDAVIGAKDGVGKGWQMLIECLSAGRGISLPSTSSGGAKLVSRSVSGYSAIRQQFGVSISKFEGVEEVLARIASRTYALDAMRQFTAGAVDLGSKPAVISAIAKYHATEMFRQVINDGMDVMGGRGIIRGKRNILANAYFSTPISITVEGANIMTRSLMHFGQGLMICHPYAYKEMDALEKGDVKNFDRYFFSHVNHLISNFVRSTLMSITRGYIRKPFKRCFTGQYERKIAWCSATFALLADFALARFGGNLKMKEKLNGRFGDVLSAMYISTSILKKFKESEFKDEEKLVAEHALKEQLSKAQIAIEGIYQNIFSGFGKIILLPFAFFARLNSFTCPSDDVLSHKISKDFTHNGKLRDALSEGIFINNDKEDNLGRIENALKLFEKAQAASFKIKAAIKNKTLPRKKIEELFDEALRKSVINSEEKNLLQEAYAAISDAMEVDDYAIEKNSYHA